MFKKLKAGKPDDIITQLGFAGLFVYAFMFFEERLFADAAYYITRVIHHEVFWVEHHRNVLICSQILPLIAVKLGLSLKFILTTYSLGHVLFFYAIYWFSRYWFENKQTGILLVMLQTVGFLHGYFTPMFEMYYGCGLLVLFMVIFRKSSGKIANLVLLGVIEILALTSHPFCFILFVIIIVIHCLSKWEMKKQLWVVGIIIICTAIYKVVTPSEYEQEKTVMFFQVMTHNDFGLKYLYALCGFLLKYYKEILILVVISIAFFVFTRKYRETILWSAAFFCTLAIVNFSYYGFEHTRYIEQAYFPLVFLICYVFTIEVLPSMAPKWRVALYAIATLLILNRMVLISHEGEGFRYRVNTMKQLVEHVQPMEGSKFIIRSLNIDYQNSNGPNWSYPIETMLLSGLRTDLKTVTICTDTDWAFNDNGSKLSPDEFIFRRWEIFKDSIANSSYFNVQSSPYQWLNKNLPLPDDLSLFGSNIRLVVPQKKMRMKTGTTVRLPVAIVNHNDQPIYSQTANKIFISYHWLRDDRVETWDGLRTPIEVDVAKTYTQRILINVPENPDRYILQIDMLVEGIAWFNINSTISVEVH